MSDLRRRRRMYDLEAPKRSVRHIWQGAGTYYVVLLQAGNPDWVGLWSSEMATVGKLTKKDDLAEFLDWATHVVDNARKLGMIDGRPVTIYAFHELQMPTHHLTLGIPDVAGEDSAAWMRVVNRHPFTPDSYTRLDSVDNLGALDFEDIRPALERLVGEGFVMTEEGEGPDDGDPREPGDEDATQSNGEGEGH